MHAIFINNLIQLHCLRRISNTIKLYVQVFLRMNTWLFETCPRQYNWIKSLMKKVNIVLVLTTYVYHNAGFKKPKDAIFFFLIFCWPCISIYLFININQLDALNFIISLFQASTCFEHMRSSSGGQNCIILSLVSSNL